MSFPATDVIYFGADLNLPACVYFTAEFHHNKQSQPQWQIEFERHENFICSVALHTRAQIHSFFFGEILSREKERGGLFCLAWCDGVG